MRPLMTTPKTSDSSPSRNSSWPGSAVNVRLSSARRVCTPGSRPEANHVELRTATSEPWSCMRPVSRRETCRRQGRWARGRGPRVPGRGAGRPDARGQSLGSSWPGPSAAANRSPRSASRARIVRIVQRSGRSAGSSSSSQAIGAETGRPGAGRGEYGADERPVPPVLGVVQASATAAAGPSTTPSSRGPGRRHRRRARPARPRPASPRTSSPREAGRRPGRRACRSPSARRSPRDARTLAGRAGRSRASRPRSCASPGSMSTSAQRGSPGASIRRRPGMDLQRRLVAEPGERRDAIGDDVGVGTAVGRVRLAPARHPVGRARGHVLLPEELAVDPVGVAGQVERAAREVGEQHRCDEREVADQVALGHRRRRRRRSPRRRRRPPAPPAPSRAPPGARTLSRFVSDTSRPADPPGPAAGGQRVEGGELVLRLGRLGPATRRRCGGAPGVPPAPSATRRPASRRGRRGASGPRRPSRARGRPLPDPRQPGARPRPGRPRGPPRRTLPGARSRRATSRRSRRGSRAPGWPRRRRASGQLVGARRRTAGSRGRAARRARPGGGPGSAASRPLPTRPAYRSRPSSMTPTSERAEVAVAALARHVARPRPAPGWAEP